MCLLRPVKSMSLASSLGIVSSTWPCYARRMSTSLSSVGLMHRRRQSNPFPGRRKRPWDCPCPNAWRGRPRIPQSPKRQTHLCKTRISKRSAPRQHPTTTSEITVADVTVNIDMLAASSLQLLRPHYPQSFPQSCTNLRRIPPHAAR